MGGVGICEGYTTVLSSSLVIRFTRSPIGKLKWPPGVVPHPSPIVEHIVQSNPDAMHASVPAQRFYGFSKNIHLLHGFNLDKVTATLLTCLLGFVPRGIPLLEEVASC